MEGFVVEGEGVEADADEGRVGAAEVEAAVGLVAVEDADGFPLAVDVFALFGAQDFELLVCGLLQRGGWEGEADAGVEAGDEEVERAELRDDDAALQGWGAGRLGAVALGEAEGDDGVN